MSHEEWLRKQGFGPLLDGRPDFMRECNCNGDNVDEVCPSCLFREECEKYLAPLTEALERYTETGEG